MSLFILARKHGWDKSSLLRLATQLLMLTLALLLTINAVAAADIRARVEPMLFFDLDFGSGIVNLQESRPTKSMSPDSLEIDRFQEGFQKVSYSELDVGLTGALRFFYDRATGITENMWILAGIVPVVGKKVWSVRYADSLEEAKALGGLKTRPTTVQELKNWKNGEALSYQARGGLLYVASIGWHMVSAQAGRLAVGLWEVYIEKVSEYGVFAKITKSKLDSVYGSLGVPLASMGVSSFGNRDDSLSFLYDISSEEAAKALLDFIGGNTIPSEQLAGVPNNSQQIEAAVQRIEDFSGSSKGKGFSATVGIPLLANLSANKSKYESDEMTEGTASNQSIKAHYSLIDKDIRAKLVKIHKQNRRLFYAADYEVTNKADNTVVKGKLGRMTWKMEDEHMSARDLRSALNQMSERTGIEKINLRVPSDEVLGYSSVILDAKFNPEVTERLAKLYSQVSEREWKNWTEALIEQASQNSDINCSGQDQNRCRDEIASQIQGQARKMWKILKEMNETYERSPKDFSKAFAKWGSLIMTNRHTFQLGLMAAGSGVNLDFSVDGTRISNYQLRMVSEVSEGRIQWTISDDTGFDTSLDPRSRRSRFRGTLLSFGSPLQVPFQP